MTRRTKTTHIVLHCSATKPNQIIGRDAIREWHIGKGWADIGYAAVVKRNGLIEFGRHFDDIGAHVAGWNGSTVGVCLVGGLYPDGSEAVDDFEGLYTVEQKHALVDLVQVLKAAYPDALIVGHRDLSPDTNHDGRITQSEWLKSCPGFDVKKWCGRNGL
jgi:hypothetical protein